MSTWWLAHLGAFALMFAVDWAWAAYMNSVTRGRVLAAGAWSTGLFLLSALNVLAFVHRPILLVSGAVGAFLGTAWATHTKAGGGFNGEEDDDVE